MLTVRFCNIITLYDQLIDLETKLSDIELELQFPINMLGNKLRYRFATERRELKNKINKLKESLYERFDNY